MVCSTCETKLKKLVTPTPHRAKGPGEKGGPMRRPMLSRPSTNVPEFRACRICRTKVHQIGSHYCQSCAYKKGICAMCGKKILDTKNYKQSST